MVILAAANEWTYATKGLVVFRFIYPYKIDPAHAYAPTSKKFLVKANSKDPKVIDLDKAEQTSHNDKRMVLGFVDWVKHKSDSYYLGIVYDRITNIEQLKSVLMHEFGHTLRIAHADDEPAVMNTMSVRNFACLTRYDLQQFTYVYAIHLHQLNYCEAR